MTTPAAVELHGRFAEFRDQGAESAVVEVSSHALAQNRVDGVSFDSVLFTNLSRDHLDYHGDIKNYAETKALLFNECDKGHRIVSIDSTFGVELAKRCQPDVVVVSTDADRVPNAESYVFASAVDANESGSKISVRSSWGDGELMFPLPGAFNVENAVIVLAFLLKHGVSMSEACRSLAEVSAPPGRMQRVESAGNLPAVYVDYAHTPAAIEAALHALRAHCRGKLWCVFGCGGDRDAGKRSLMGLAAEQSADHIVITNDNPRGEQSDTIISAIVAGLMHAADATIIADRAAAIAWTIAAAAPADAVLLAGKGHENYQLTGDQRLRFSDYDVAAANLASRAEAIEASE
jgi:UDP-N-acetylmuramoyl-L-alanyl-D-glutamate--2,6-diaminopimelate ligase